MQRLLTCLVCFALPVSVLAVASCSSSSSSSGDMTSDGSTDSPAVQDTGIVDAGIDGPSPTTTIAAARQSFLEAGSASPITVNAVVTGVQGPSGDQVIWYVEDPNGGPYSGVSVFCDPLAAKTCPCKAGCTPHVEAPPIDTLVSITGTISEYKGQLQLEPTAQTILQSSATPPPVFSASATDLGGTVNSPYRGVYVKFPTTVTVDDLTPAALYDSQCTTDGGMQLCTGCAPPTYSGFEVNGPGANAFFVEETFFPFVPLQNSPECLTQSGAVVVTQGETFPSMSGILDVDPYSARQVLAPVQPSDYGQ